MKTKERKTERKKEKQYFHDSLSKGKIKYG